MSYPRAAACLFLVAASGAMLPTAWATSCTADAEFVHAYPANEIPSKFKFKFKVTSDDCKEYGCTGHINYRIHFQYKDGDSNSSSTLVSYRLSAGQHAVEITDEHYPSGATMKIAVRDVEIGEVSCTTP